MEVIPLIRSSATGSEASNGDNGIKRRVQEWSRLDRLTGILEHARVEADQWTNHTANTKHKYGKVRTTRVITIIIREFKKKIDSFWAKDKNISF